MKDTRVAAFRSALDSLVASLDATVRIARWTDAPDAIPAPLKKDADRIDERLRAAVTLAETKVVAAPPVMTRITAMAESIKGLDAAYASYRAEIAARPEAMRDAALTLEAAIGDAKDAEVT